MEEIKSSKSQCPPIALTNYLKGSVLFDTLHHSSIQQSGPALCGAGLCQSALILPKGGSSQNSSTVFSEIEDFFNQYFVHHAQSNIVKEQRLKEAFEEQSQANTVTVSAEELEFAAKTAWRNSSRCIGRIQWKKLKFFDGRQVRSTKDMFKSICDHIAYATNGGNIRSAITVFPSTGKVCRIWNSQYIGYAGFENADGTILGDPARAEFTDICLKLGWKPKKTRFEILPLVLQYGDEVELYEIPKHLILEVPISHPRYPKLAELQLQWYALPAVSSMNLKCTGQVFRCCAFNGWYMSTEVVRDLCDPQRYNLLKVIAESMDLNTCKPPLYWKDIAAIELNIAVVFSFQNKHVTITDHHSASDSFIKHMENEQNSRGGCPADWVWVTPPLGGLLTSVFHQEMLNYNLRPSYDYQENPWMEDNWRARMKIAKEEKLSFKSVQLATIRSIRIFGDLKKKRIKCTILYATETGQSEQYSRELSSLLLDAGLNLKVLIMNDYNVSIIQKEQLLLVVTSTFGNGDAPGNGEEFERRIKELTSSKQSFPEVRFGVFGLGSSSYPKFCAFAKRIDSLFDLMGMTRLVPIGFGDDTGDQRRQFILWAQLMCERVRENFGVNIEIKIYLRDETQIDFTHYKMKATEADNSVKNDLMKDLEFIHHKDILECQLLSVESIMKSDSSLNTILVRLYNEGVMFYPGDHAAVYPMNSPEEVEILCNHAVFDNDSLGPETVTEISSSNQGNSTKFPPTSLQTALTHYLNIESPPKQGDIVDLLQVCLCSDTDRERLNQLSTNLHEYNNLIELRPTWAEFLLEFPTIKVPAIFYFLKLPLLLPRYYSISSCQMEYPDEIHLTVSVLQYSIESQGQTRLRKGLCSNWLQNLQQDSKVYMHIRRNQSFYLPSDVNTPVVMIGAGSGLAPFRGFWQQRKWQLNYFGGEANDGCMYLFQGMRSESSLLHYDEIMQFMSEGILKDVFTAFSRDKNHAKCYVQDKISQHKDLLCHLILQDGGHIFICGDVKMADEVQILLKSTLQPSEENNTSKDVISHLKETGRYHEDVYSILLQ